MQGPQYISDRGHRLSANLIPKISSRTIAAGMFFRVMRSRAKVTIVKHTDISDISSSVLTQKSTIYGDLCLRSESERINLRV